MRLSEQLTKLHCEKCEEVDAKCEEAERDYGSIYKDLKQLYGLVMKVVQYFESKSDP